MKLILEHEGETSVLVLVPDDAAGDVVLAGPAELRPVLHLGGLSGTALYARNWQVFLKSHAGYYAAGPDDLAAAIS